jgi:hypothetical protein
VDIEMTLDLKVYGLFLEILKRALQSPQERTHSPDSTRSLALTFHSRTDNKVRSIPLEEIRIPAEQAAFVTKERIAWQPALPREGPKQPLMDE